MKKNKYLWDITNPMGYNNQAGYYKTQKEINFVRKFIPKTPIKILDIGGGSGRVSLPLVKYNHLLTVIDTNLEALNILSARNKSVRIIHGDFEKINLSGTFELILAIEVIGYLTNIRMAFEKIYDLLDRNGIFIFKITNTCSWRFYLRKMKKHTDYNYITLNDLYKTIDSIGFKIERMEGFNWMPFRVNSDTFLVKWFSKLEELLSLDKIITQSPCILISVKK